MSSLLLIALFSASSAWSAPFSIDDWSTLIEQKQPRSLEEALPLLPEDFRTNPVLMRSSRSAQGASAASPRVLLSNEDGSFVLTFTGEAYQAGGQRLEMMQFHRETKRFEFSEVEFTAGQPAVVHRNVAFCSGCHGSGADTRPLWEAFPNWPGAYGENQEKTTGAEATELRTFIAGAANHPRYRSLIDLDRTHLKNDREGRFSGRANSELTRKLVLLNLDRMAERVAASANYERYRYSIVASLYCMNEPGFARDFFPENWTAPATFRGFEERADPGRGSEIAFYWGFLRRGVSPMNWGMALGNMMNGEPIRLPGDYGSWGTATQELLKRLAEQDPLLVPHVGVDGRATPSCARLRSLATGR